MTGTTNTPNFRLSFCVFFFFLPCENVTCVLFLPACVGSPTTPENENDPTRKYSNKLVNKKKQDTRYHTKHTYTSYIPSIPYTEHTRVRVHTYLYLFFFRLKKIIIIINPRRVISIIQGRGEEKKVNQKRKQKRLSSDPVNHFTHTSREVSSFVHPLQHYACPFALCNFILAHQIHQHFTCLPGFDH